MIAIRTWLSVLLAAGMLAGCKGTGGPGLTESEGREIDRSAEHEWPPVSLDSAGREHVIAMQAPNPGWRLDLDAVQETRAGNIVYATVRQPDPERMYPQVITNLRLGTTVPSTEAIELVVRMADPDGGNAGPYRRAAGVK